MAGSDEELLRVVGEGGTDRSAAWNELVRRHTPRLYAVARSFRLDQATASDVVQTAWLRLIERAGQIDKPASVGPWMCAIVRNEARRVLTRRRAIPVDNGWDLVVDARIGEPDAAMIDHERRLAVRAAFARLGEECGQLLRLLARDPPLSYAEVAAAIGRPIGAVGPTRRRCIDHLRGFLPARARP